MIEIDENVKKVASLLKVLANENRLLILCGLIKKPMNVGEIAKLVPKIGQSALSQNLSALKAHRVLDSEKVGQQMIYSIANERVIRVMEVLYENFCRQNE